MKGLLVGLVLLLPLMAGCLQHRPEPEAVTDETTEDPEDSSSPTKTTKRTTPRKTTSRPPSSTTSGATSPPGSTGTTSVPTSTVPPPLPGVFDCEGTEVVEPFATHGTGDPQLSTLSWAALKTGFRFVVAWDSTTASSASLRYKVGHSGWLTMTDSVVRKTHVFILDSLSEGATICFEASEGAVKSKLHAAKLVNAMRAYDPVGGYYTLNLLTVAVGAQSRAMVEDGYRLFGQKLWDSTDGKIRAGTLIILYNDAENQAITAYGAGLALGGWGADVFFNYDYPEAAGYTHLDDIQKSSGFIMMNQLWEGSPLSSSNEVGSVLLHELGHYAFGMHDLYGGPGCYRADTSISVMGSSRAATEFDDTRNPCPANADVQGAYKPSWEHLRTRFVEIPDRESIDPGPAGHGGALQVRPLDALRA